MPDSQTSKNANIRHRPKKEQNSKHRQHLTSSISETNSLSHILFHPGLRVCRCSRPCCLLEKLCVQWGLSAFLAVKESSALERTYGGRGAQGRVRRGECSLFNEV